MYICVIHKNCDKINKNTSAKEYLIKMYTRKIVNNPLDNV